MTLKPFSDRYKNSETARKESSDAIVAELARIGTTSQLDGLVVPLNPPAIPGLGKYRRF